MSSSASTGVGTSALHGQSLVPSESGSAGGPSSDGRSIRHEPSSNNVVPTNTGFPQRSHSLGSRVASLDLLFDLYGPNRQEGFAGVGQGGPLADEETASENDLFLDFDDAYVEDASSEADATKTETKTDAAVQPPVLSWYDGASLRRVVEFMNGVKPEPDEVPFKSSRQTHFTGRALKQVGADAKRLNEVDGLVIVRTSDKPPQAGMFHRAEDGSWWMYELGADGTPANAAPKRMEPETFIERQTLLDPSLDVRIIGRQGGDPLLKPPQQEPPLKLPTLNTDITDDDLLAETLKVNNPRARLLRSNSF